MMDRPRRTEGVGPGLLLVDKPEGPTSHDIVSRARRVLRVRRIGHTGTLDPFASGLLLLCVGRATRLAEYFHVLSKQYDAVVVLGAETDTDDRTGARLRTSDGWRRLDPRRLEQEVGRFQGIVEQVPPTYSAKKVEGRRAYEAARAGDALVLRPRMVHVHAIVVRSFRPPRVGLTLTVSTGTYVRALARDLGRRLGCYGHLGALRRTAIGPFRVEAAVPPEALGRPSRPGARSWLDPAGAVAWMPVRRLSPEEATRIRNGVAIAEGDIEEPREPGWLPDVQETRDGPVALISDGVLTAVARRRAGRLHPERVFRES